MIHFDQFNWPFRIEPKARVLYLYDDIVIQFTVIELTELHFSLEIYDKTYYQTITSRTIL